MMQSYQTTSEGWYKEITGPIVIRDSSNRQIGVHKTRSLYSF